MILIDQTREKMLNELADKYDLKLVVLFGSQVSGRIHQESDYDIAYLSEKELSLKEKSGFMYGLMPILKIRDERLVNIVDMKTAGPLMLYSITSKGQVLFEREPSFSLSLKLYAWKVFIDTQSFRDNYFKIIKKRIQARFAQGPSLRRIKVRDIMYSCFEKIHLLRVSIIIFIIEV